MNKLKILIVILIVIIITTITTITIILKPNLGEVVETSSENTSVLKEGMEVTILGGSNEISKGNLNSNGYVIRTINNKIIVVDGGRDTDAQDLYSYIVQYGNGKVDYWYITHPHTDHIGALIELLQDDNINLEIDNLYYSFNTKEWYKEYDDRGYETESTIIDELKNEKIKNDVSCYKGQVIEMDNVECEIIRIANPEITDSDNGNDSSMVFKFVAKDVDKSMIFLGDSYVYASEELLEEPEKLKSYAVQMSHHGQNGVSKEVYDAIEPTVCFWNCPEYLYNNDNATGYNTGKWQSIIVRGWMEEMGATNILAFEGDQTIRFTKDGFEIL